jgi:hypothetical protein
LLLPWLRATFALGVVSVGRLNLNVTGFRSDPAAHQEMMVEQRS